MTLQQEDIVAVLLFSLIGFSVESYNNPVKSYPTTCGSSVPWGSVTYSTCSICALRGSSVELNSTYTFPPNETLQRTVWHLHWQADRKEPIYISDEPSYHNRVESRNKTAFKSTLLIRDLKESDARQYFFRILTHSNRFTGAPGIQVSVTGLFVMASPDPVTEGGYATLTCRTTCTLSGSNTYVWYKNGQPHRHSTGYNHLHLTSVSTEDSGSYSCAVKGKEQLISPSLLIDVKYCPKNTSAYVYPVGEISEGTSVALVCSSSANPPVHRYSWFKRNGTGYIQIESAGQNYSIPTVSCDHSGEYYCRAENIVGEARSALFKLNVTYPPRSPKTVVSPSGDVVEGISMILTCSSEAKPAVHTYTWYKKSGAHSSKLGVGQNYSIPNVTCGHSGEYHCQAENLKGSTNSTSVFVDVLYPPRNLSVLVSSFDGVVTLTCSSDANPVVTHYTWHKRTGTDSSLRGTGRYLTLDSGESGLYYCQAKNGLGATESNLLPISEKITVGRYAAVVIVAVGALIVIVSILLRIRKKKMGATETTEGTSDGELDGSGPVYANVSRVAMTSGPKSGEDTESEIHYSSVYFKQCDKQEVPLYSRPEMPKLPLVEDEVLYSTVKSHHS